MRKLLVGLTLGLSAAAANAQSVLTFDVVFDQVYEASGAFTPNLTPVGPGPFNSNQPVPPPNLKAHVVMSAVPSGTQLTAVNTITLNGTFSTESGNSPSNGWTVHTFNAATFNLLKPAGNSFFGIDFVTNANDWPTFISTSANGYLSDHGPAAAYGGTCPYFFGCASAQPGGNGAGTGTFGLFASGTNIYNTGTSLPSFPTLANAGNYPLISGTYSQTVPSTGLGFENGIDAFALQAVLDVQNSQGNGSSQPYPNGVNGYPGIVRFLTISSTGNTAYMVQGHIVTPIVDADVDSVADSLDNCPAVANFNQADTDGDARGNACDNCRLLANNTAGPTAQCDSDGDGFGNRCDGDLNNNNSTNAQDTTLFRQQLGQPSVGPLFNKADLNCSGSVNAQDTTLFRQRLGQAPGPGAGP